MGESSDRVYTLKVVTEILESTLDGSDSIRFISPLMKPSSTDWNRLTTSDTSDFLGPASVLTLFW